MESKAQKEYRRFCNTISEITGFASDIGTTIKYRKDNLGHATETKFTLWDEERMVEITIRETLEK